MSDERGAELQPGQRFGSYEIVRPLGKGAFGAVYEALRHPLKKRTALKVLHAEYVRHAEVVGRFLREAEVVAQLDHPHIVDVFDVGTHDGVPFIAMEFLDGEPLASRIEREGRLPITAAVDLMLAVFSAVATVHERGVIHRDLKPDNIFLARPATGGVQPKLLDFGIAKVRDAEKALTRTNAVMGTPFYMSPEQAEESKSITAAADQWSLGVILFEALAGKKPFDGESLLALLNSICLKPAPDLCEVEPSIPRTLGSLVMRALEKKPDARFPSVREFGRALLPFASPGAQSHWREFFTGEGAAETEAAVLPSYTNISPAHAETLGERRSAVPDIARSSIAPATSGTLEPATRSALGLGSRRSRVPMFVAASFGAMVLVGGAIIASRPSGSDARPAPSVRAATTAAPLPSAPVTAVPTAPAPAPTVAPAPEPAPVPAPAVVAPVAVVDAGVAPRRSGGRHGSRSGSGSRRGEPRDQSNCVNGICPPI